MGTRHLTAGMTLVLVLTIAQVSSAATFWDWLWGRSPYYQANHLVHRPITSYQSPTVLPVQGTVQPAYGTNPCATTAVANPCGQCVSQPMMMNTRSVGSCCRPVLRRYQTSAIPAYRTTWFRVPVTSYRPVTVMSPMAGISGSQLQPCNGYTWQARRVPVTSYRPVYSWFHRPVQTTPTFFSQPAISASQCAPCGTGAVTGTTVAPSVSTPQQSLAPIPLQQSAPAATGEPASRPPTLNQGVLRPSTSPRPGTTFSGPLGTRRHSAPAAVRGMTPIRDPEARPASPETNKVIAPQLSNPQNHTAASVQPWAVVPISWGAPVKAATETPTRREAEPVWDAQGWTSAR